MGKGMMIKQRQRQSQSTASTSSVHTGTNNSTEINSLATGASSNKTLFSKKSTSDESHSWNYVIKKDHMQCYVGNTSSTRTGSSTSSRSNSSNSLASSCGIDAVAAVATSCSTSTWTGETGMTASGCTSSEESNSNGSCSKTSRLLRGLLLFLDKQQRNPLLQFLSFLRHDNGLGTKSQSWHHPLTVAAVHFCIVFVSSVRIHDYYVKHDEYEQCMLLFEQQQHGHRRPVIGAFMLLYVCGVFARRATYKDPTVAYEYCWLCNTTLWISWYALLTNRPILAIAYCVTIGIDQLLWYVDLTVYLAIGKFPIGVAKYLFWQGNADAKITATHHLWTIPLTMYACPTVNGIPTQALSLSFVYMAISVGLSRYMIPEQSYTASTKSAVYKESGSGTSTTSNSNCANDTTTRPETEASNTTNNSSSSSPAAAAAAAVIPSRYLNVNLSHAIWKDIDFSFLALNHDCPNVCTYTFRLLWRWQMFNTMVYTFLYGCCMLFSSTSSSSSEISNLC